MYCPEFILISNKYLYLQIMCKGDYNNKRDVPKTHWFNLLRYSVTLFPASNKWRTRINPDAKWRVVVSNFIFRLKGKFNCAIGRHDYLIKDKCYHCDKEKNRV